MLNWSSGLFVDRGGARVHSRTGEDARRSWHRKAGRSCQGAGRAVRCARTSTSLVAFAYDAYGKAVRALGFRLGMRDGVSATTAEAGEAGMRRDPGCSYPIRR